MHTDGSSFLQRAHRFLAELKAKRYPNSSSLAKLCGCSENTAQRVIYRLRDEYLVPIDYDPSSRGYFLTDYDYELPAQLPPGKDELTALLLARELIGTLNVPDLVGRLDNLWYQLSANNPVITRELPSLATIFSSDSTSVADLADWGLLKYVNAAHVGEHVEILYKSPWRHTEPKRYRGRIEKVHQSDGSLYLLFRENSDRAVILNASFIRSFEILSEPCPMQQRATVVSEGEPDRAAFWLEGFGVWAGTAPEEITVHIEAPAAEFYAAQRWHPEQEDSWQGATLVRRFPGIVSPELVRRMLSISAFVSYLSPASLREQVVGDARKLVERLGE